MKKFTMLIITVIMLLITTISYAYENFNIKVPEYKKPNFKMTSSKFGEIKDIVWQDSYNGNSLLILSMKKVNNENMSFLYFLDIDNGKSSLIGEFPSHKILNDMILFDSSFSSSDIITASANGIIRTEIITNDKNEMLWNNQIIPIEDFEDATSIEFKGNLFYSKPDDKFIYIKSLFRNGSYLFNQSGNNPDIIKHYKDPYYIVSANNLNSVLSYTSVSRDGIHLYSMEYNGKPIVKLNRPIIKNVVNINKTNSHFGFGYAGMNLKENSNENELNLFKINFSHDDRESNLQLDTIPFNLDRFGTVPAIDLTQNSSDSYSLVYTSYDENHSGQIKLANYNEVPKVILIDKSLYGPLRINRKHIDGKENKLILYFTYENNIPHAKICDIEGNLVKDITEMLK